MKYEVGIPNYCWDILNCCSFINFIKGKLMNTKTKYYRTYITHIETPNGYRVYAGKHESYYEQATQDPYYGSGHYPRSAVKKYGKSCIKNIEWFDHDLSHLPTEVERSKQLGSIEIEFIKSVKEQYGDVCKNLAGGGDGNVWVYADDAMRERHRKATAIAYQNAKAEGRIKPTVISEEARQRISAIHKEKWNMLDPVEKEKHRQRIKQIMARPEVKEKIRNANLGRKVIHSEKFLESQRIRKEQHLAYKAERKAERKKLRQAKLEIQKEETRKRREEEKRQRIAFREQQVKDPEYRKYLGDTISKSQRKLPHWKCYDELHSLWVENNSPKHVMFRKVAIANGYPDVNYGSMVGKFNNVPRAYNTPPLPEANWHYYDELREIWLVYGKPSTNKKFCNIIEEWLYPEADYKDMLNKFKEGA